MVARNLLCAAQLLFRMCNAHAGADGNDNQQQRGSDYGFCVLTRRAAYAGSVFTWRSYAFSRSLRDSSALYNISFALYCCG